MKSEACGTIPATPLATDATTSISSRTPNGMYAHGNVKHLLLIHPVETTIETYILHLYVRYTYDIVCTEEVSKNWFQHLKQQRLYLECYISTQLPIGERFS